MTESRGKHGLISWQSHVIVHILKLIHTLNLWKRIISPISQLLPNVFDDSEKIIQESLPSGEQVLSTNLNTVEKFSKD